MPKGETWLGCAAKEPLIGMDKAGSRDLAVSMTASYNDESLEYLSAEERASLMFLQSIIESLEMEEDSGLSNDESDPSNLAGQNRLEDVSKLQNHNSEIDQKSFLNGVPTPRLENGLTSVQLKAKRATSRPKAPAAAAELSASREPVPCCTPVSEPKAAGTKPTAPAATIAAVQARTPGAVTSSKPQGAGSEPTLPKVGAVPKPLELSADHTPSEPAINLQVAGLDATSSSATSCLHVDEIVDSMPKGVSVDSKPPKHHAGVPFELDMKLIPPPSDFRDNEPEKGRPMATELRGPLTYSDLEQLRKKRTSTASPGAQEAIHSKRCIDLPVMVSTSSTPSPVASTISSPEALEPKSPPAVAPKPKRLPSNIIIKSNKSDSPSGPHQHSPVDGSTTDPQMVRLEALRKLGLLKCDNVDFGPVVPLKSRRSWVPPSPRSPAANQTQAPAQILKPATTSLPDKIIARTPTPATLPPAVTAPGSNPAPPTTPAPPATQTPPPPTTQAPPSALAQPITLTPASTRLSHATPPPCPITNPIPVPAPAKFNDNAKTPATPSRPTKHIPPPVGFKSASLERSGMGLSNYMASNASLKTNPCPSSSVSPGDLRSSRRRPASLGTGKDFVNVLGEASQPQPGHGESQNKLPRSQGISVFISPNSKNGEERREALKKLGLLRD